VQKPSSIQQHSLCSRWQKFLVPDSYHHYLISITVVEDDQKREKSRMTRKNTDHSNRDTSEKNHFRTDFYRKTAFFRITRERSAQVHQLVDGYYDDDVVITLTTSSRGLPRPALRVPSRACRRHLNRKKNNEADPYGGGFVPIYSNWRCGMLFPCPLLNSDVAVEFRE